MIALFGDPNGFGKVPDPPEYGCQREFFDENECWGCDRYSQCADRWEEEDETEK